MSNRTPCSVLVFTHAQPVRGLHDDRTHPNNHTKGPSKASTPIPHPSSTTILRYLILLNDQRGPTNSGRARPFLEVRALPSRHLQNKNIHRSVSVSPSPRKPTAQRGSRGRTWEMRSSNSSSVVPDSPRPCPCSKRMVLLIRTAVPNGSALRPRMCLCAPRFPAPVANLRELSLNSSVRQWMMLQGAGACKCVRDSRGHE